ncbi:MAG: tetratricopeptide repeat protein [bacterium]
MNFRRPSVLVVSICMAVSLLVVFPLKAQDRSSAFEFPVKAYNDGNYRVAIRGFNQFIGEYPEDSRISQVRFWKGEAYYQLEELKKAFDTFYKLHKAHPTFKQQDVLIRLAYLADKLGRQQKVIELLSSRLLEKIPEVQNYLVKWRLENNNHSTLASQLSLISKDKLTDSARQFMSQYKRSQLTKDLQNALERGDWSQRIRDKMHRLSVVTRENLIVLAIKRMWDNQEYSKLLQFGDKIPYSWQTPEFKLYMAEAAVELEDFAEAEKRYRELLNQTKFRGQVHFSLAWVLYEQGMTEEPLRLLNNVNWAGLKEPFSAEALRLKGDILLAKGELRKAQDAYRKAIDTSEKSGFINESRYWLAWSYLEAGDVAQAYRMFNQVAAAGNVNLADVYQARGRTALEMGNYKEAEKNYRKALKFSDSEKRNHEVHYELAQTSYERGNYQKAFDLFLELNNEDLPSRLEASVAMGIGRAGLEVGRYQMSWSVLQAHSNVLLEQFPREYRYFAGQAALKTGRHDVALQYFDKLLKKYPDSPFAREGLRLGFRVELSRMGATIVDTNSIRRLRKKIQQSPKDMRIQMLEEWATALSEHKYYDHARDRYEEIMEKSSSGATYSHAVNRITDLLLKQEKIGELTTFLESNLESLPQHPQAAEALYRLLRFDYDRRNLKRLRKWTTTFLDHFGSSPYHGHVHFMLGEINRNRDQVDKARDYYRQALQFNPPLAIKNRARYRLAELYMDQSEYKKAIPLLDKLSEVEPDFVKASSLQAMRARAYYETNDYVMARKILEKIEITNDVQRMILVRIYTKQGQYSKAGTILSQMNPEKGSTLAVEQKYYQGLVQYKQGNLEKAETRWYRIMYLYPDWEGTDRTIYRLIKLLNKQDRTGEVKDLKKKLKKEYPDSSYLDRINSSSSSKQKTIKVK